MQQRGLRWIYVRVRNLPPDAALWRVQRQPETVNGGDSETIRTGDPDKIRAFFDEHLA